MDVDVLEIELSLLAGSDSVEDGLHLPLDVDELSPLVEHLSAKLFSASTQSFLLLRMELFNSHQGFVLLFGQFFLALLLLFDFVFTFIHQLCESGFYDC